MSGTEKIPVLFDESEIAESSDDRRRTAINRALSFVDQAGVRVVFYPTFRGSR